MGLYGKREKDIDDGEHYPYLVPKGDGFGFENGDSKKNILIEGDNYHALEIFQYTHKGKIDVIYIDPPYNTGKKNEFRYGDRWVDVNDGYRHSYWLSFMNKRLRLAKDLLAKDGVIFISIDDNEQARLKLLCDEVFGANNFLAQLVWKKKYTGGKHARFYTDLHEYILVYAKNISQLKVFEIERQDCEQKKFSEKDEFFEERGGYYTRPLKSNLEERRTLVYPVELPDGTIMTTQWLVGKDRFDKEFAEKRIIFKQKRDKTWNVYKKYYEKDSGGKVRPPSLIEQFPNNEAKEELKDIFNITEGRDNVFYTVKPTKLIHHLIQVKLALM